MKKKHSGSKMMPEQMKSAHMMEGMEEKAKGSNSKKKKVKGGAAYRSVRV